MSILPQQTGGQDQIFGVLYSPQLLLLVSEGGVSWWFCAVQSYQRAEVELVLVHKKVFLPTIFVSFLQDSLESRLAQVLRQSRGQLQGLNPDYQSRGRCCFSNHER